MTRSCRAYGRGVTLRFIRPGKPIENACVENFNGKFRGECLNEHWFVSLVDAKAAIEAWRIDYNTVRSHSSLGGRTPDQFAKVSVGARRLTPARSMKGLNPRTSHYPCSGFWGQVNRSVICEMANREYEASVTCPKDKSYGTAEQGLSDQRRQGEG